MPCPPKSINQPTNQPTNQPINQSINPSTKQSTNQSIHFNSKQNKSIQINQSEMTLINHPVQSNPVQSNPIQSINQSINPSIHQASKQASKQAIHPSIHPSINQSINQSTVPFGVMKVSKPRHVKCLLLSHTPPPQKNKREALFWCGCKTEPTENQTIPSSILPA